MLSRCTKNHSTKAVFISLILICLPYFLKSQNERLLKETKTSHFINLELKNSNNQHLKNIANKLNKSPIEDIIALQIELILEIINLEKDKYEINILARKKEDIGTFLYRKIDIFEKLYPTTAKFILEIKFPFEERQKREKTFYLDSTNQWQNVFSWTDTNYNNVIIPSIDIIFDSFEYGEKWEQNLNHTIQIVDKYHKSDSIFSLWSEKIDKLNFEKTELIPLDDFTLDEIEKEFEFFNFPNIAKQLKLPDNQTDNFKNFETKIKNKREDLDYKLFNIDRIFIEKARKEKSRYNLIGAIYNYNKSLEYHPLNTTALIELAQITLDENNQKETIDLIKKIFTSTWPQGDEYYKAKNLASQLYDIIINQGDKLMQAEEFHKAIETYHLANDFCDSIRINICSNKHKTGIINSKKGVLNSYFNVIDKALDRNLLPIAENYAREAKRYQMENIEEIPNDDDIQTVVDKIISKYVEEALTNINKSLFQLGIEQLDNAASLGKTFRSDFSLAYLEETKQNAYKGAFDNIITESEKLLSQNKIPESEEKYKFAMEYFHQYNEWIKDTTKSYSQHREIQKTKYSNFIKTGIEEYENGKFIASLETFHQAKQLENHYNFHKNEVLDSMLISIAEPVVKEKIQLLNMNIWRNELEIAKDILDELNIIITQANLETNSELMTDYQSIKTSFENKECEYAQNEASKFQREIDAYIQNQAFYSACNSMGKNKILHHKFSRCISWSPEQEELFQKYLPASLYDSLIQEADFEIRLNNIEKAMQIFVIADSIYDARNLEQIKVYRKKLTSFFYVNHNNETIAECIKHIQITELAQQGVLLIELLRKNNQSAKKYISLQKTLGKNLREMDKNKHPSVPLKELIKQYKVDSNWYFVFKFYYLKRPILTL